jgi:DNA (cytosine-5)-methyltransferase 1
MLTAKEYLRLMGYEETDYERMHNAGITDKQIKLLAGNSICVPVLMAIFRRLEELGTICSAEETKRGRR